jgi:hypothetical protein
MERSRFSTSDEGFDTLHQGADYLTKELGGEAIEQIYKINQGW